MPADPQKKTLYKRSGVELLVIVVGVLIALWADQWWSDREDNRTEQTYLASLNEDINATLKELDSTVAPALWIGAKWDSSGSDPNSGGMLRCKNRTLKTTRSTYPCVLKER